MFFLWVFGKFVGLVGYLSANYAVFAKWVSLEYEQFFLGLPVHGSCNSVSHCALFFLSFIRCSFLECCIWACRRDSFVWFFWRFFSCCLICIVLWSSFVNISFFCCSLILYGHFALEFDFFFFVVGFFFGLYDQVFFSCFGLFVCVVLYTCCIGCFCLEFAVGFLFPCYQTLQALFVRSKFFIFYFHVQRFERSSFVAFWTLCFSCIHRFSVGAPKLIMAILGFAFFYIVFAGHYLFCFTVQCDSNFLLCRTRDCFL